MTAAPAPAHTATPLAEELRERVRGARARGSALRIRAAGTWMDAGRPVAAAEEMLIPSAGEPAEYVPGDLTITVPAGMSLGRLHEITAAHGQWLALDPPGSDDGTIGATAATASAGPLAHLFGTPRDQVLGVELVTGRGDVVRGGGRVVKNVAGFDLTRLAVGAWGMSGVITELTLRLRAKPPEDVTVCLAAALDASHLEALLARLRRAPVAPWALELLDPAAARAAGLPGEPVLLARIAGTAAAVRAQRRALESIADVEDAPDTVWPSLRRLDDGAAAVLRWSDLPTGLPSLLPSARRLAEVHEGMVHASIGRGVVRVMLRVGDDDALRSTAIAMPAATLVVERAPAAVWNAVPSSIGTPLARRVVDAFDPDRVLNPGILGE